MIRKLVYGLFFYTLCSHNTSVAQIPIGAWREHLNYQQTIQVVQGDLIYCATKTNLFSVDEKNEINRISKINGLNDIGISCIGWDELTQQLVIAYENSNIDIVKGSIIKNIADIQLSTISGNKKIQHIYCNNGIAYLSAGLGIILIDLKRYEIKDTWIIGSNGVQTSVQAVTNDNQFFYAATNEGLKKAPITASNLANFSNWNNVSSGFSAGSTRFVGIVNNQPIVVKNDSVFFLNGWILLYASTSWQIMNASISANKLHLTQKNNSGDARVIILSATGNIEQTISQPGIISFPKWAITSKGAIWVADQYGGLSKFFNGVEQFIPNGPTGIASGEFVFSETTLIVASGSINNAWNYLYNRDGISTFTEGNWTSKGAFNTPLLDTVLDFITLAVDPKDQSIWAGSYGGGLVQFSKTGTTIFKQGNSSLKATIGDPNSFRVSGLAFDHQQNLWVSNYGSATPINLKKPDGSWKSFSVPFPLVENATAQLIADDFNQIWIVSPKNNGLICYQFGENIDNINDDRWKLFKQGTGNGNLPSNNVLSIAKDKMGSIWVGTDDGIGIINCNNNLFGVGGCDATLPIIQEDQFAGYLFKGQQVQCIAIDGANRKWIGTQNGAWLISADGKKQIQHFTASNSPLLNDDVKKIGINPITGEVFFATFSGICSYRSTATTASENIENILVFPNPVPPNFNGTIAIKGLVDNAVVKITELNGRLVFQTRSLGGQAIWNGLDYTGKKIATGLYLVIVRDDTGAEKIVTKIIITSGR